MRSAEVDSSLIVRLQGHVPQPNFDLLANITPFSNEAFHHPPTLDPRSAKAVYRKVGINLRYSREALRIIRAHRRVEFRLDPQGEVWVKPYLGSSLSDLIDTKTLKMFMVWNAFHDMYRLRNAGALHFAKAELERLGLEVVLKRFPVAPPSLPTIRTPRNVNVKLYPFQDEAVDFILGRDGRTCLFDEMGLGKTITATSALLRLVKEKKASRALIVTPNAVVEQWGTELTGKFNLNPTLVSSRSGVKQRAILYLNPLVVLNYELLRNDLSYILRSNFDTLILDEVTRVKNLGTQSSEAVKKIIVRNLIALTGTPLENHLGELFNIVDIVSPGYFGRYREDFLATYSLERRRRAGTHPTVKPETLHELRGKLRKVAIRRTKSQVLKQLPALTMQYLYTEPTRKQKMIYDLLAASLTETVKKEYEYSRSEGGGFNPHTANRIRLYTLLREACADITLISNYLSRKSVGDASASSFFDLGLFRRLVLLAKGVEPDNAKLVELKELVKDLVEQEHKLVIFSQFIPVVNLISDQLRGEGIATLTYHGQLPNYRRTSNLESFVRRREQKVLASTDAGQFGLNLQAADVVVNYDLPWNPARLQQRIARLHRVGQENNVLAVNFIVKGTIEEYVREVIERKMKLFKDVTVTEIAETEEFSLQELIEMFGLNVPNLITRIQERYGLHVERPSRGSN